MFKEGTEIDNAGRIANLLNTFLRAWELKHAIDIEARLDALEDAAAGAVQEREDEVVSVGRDRAVQPRP